MEIEKELSHSKNELISLMGNNQEAICKAIPHNARTIFFQFLLGLKSACTRRAYFFDLVQFFEFLKRYKKDKVYTEVIRSDIDHFKEWSLRYGNGSGLSPATVKRRITAVSKFYTFLIRQEIVKHNPATFVERPSVPLEVKTEPFSRDELKSMLSQLNINTESGALHHALLILMSTTGMRVGEVIRIKIRDYIKEGDQGIVYSIAGKSRAFLRKELSLKCSDAIDRYLSFRLIHSDSPEDPLFIGSRGSHGDAITQRAIHKMIINLAKRSGINRAISPHSTRTYFATEALEKFDIGTVARALGHKNTIMTDAYDKRRKNQTRAIAEDLL